MTKKGVVWVNILLIEDEVLVLDALKAYLEREQYRVFVATTGNEGLTIFEKEKIDLVILDIMLPDMKGEEICQQIRAISDVYLFMLTAKGSLEHRILGLNLGADDYLVKPFSPRELVARIKTVVRRMNGPLQNINLYDDGYLLIDQSKRIVKVQEEIVPFTTTEFNLLVLLMDNKGKVLTREQLINQILGFDFNGYDRTIDVHIKNIRKKIEQDTKQPRYIVTVMKVGYKFGGTFNG